MSISSLNIGGAEIQFLELVKGVDKNKYDLRVVVMYNGVLDYRLDKINGIHIYRLNKINKYDLKSYFQYIKIINEFAPAIIYSFLPDLNVISFICRYFSYNNPKLFWGIRAGTNDIKSYSIFSQFTFYLQKIFSNQIDLAVFNSFQGSSDYLNSGFKFKEVVVIPNGIDSERFKPDFASRIEFRKKFKIKENDIVIGIVSRFEYIKGMDIFVDTAILLLQKYDNLHFFSIGHGDEKIIEKCKIIIGKFNGINFHFLGKISNPEKIICGWDIYCSTSRGEGFSNSIAEAMLCSLSVVVSNVGDSSRIVDNCGLVFKSGCITDLAEKIDFLMDRQLRNKYGYLARKRVIENFSISKMIELTEFEFKKNIKL